MMETVPSTKEIEMPIFNLTDEPFFTIQGEGFGYGLPSIFVRFSGCNLRCQWVKDGQSAICDTPYSSFKPESLKMIWSDVSKSIDQYLPMAKQIVISGGEPFLWPTQIEILFQQYIDRLPMTIETNGTILHKCWLNYEKLTLSISPKITTTESTPEKRRFLADAIIASMERNEKTNHILKFVVQSIEDEQAIKDFLGMLSEFEALKVIVMPEGTTAAQIDEKQTMVAEMAMRNGWQYSDRLHLRLWYGRRNT